MILIVEVIECCQKSKLLLKEEHLQKTALLDIFAPAKIPQKRYEKNDSCNRGLSYNATPKQQKGRKNEPRASVNVTNDRKNVYTPMSCLTEECSIYKYVKSSSNTSG